MSTIAAISSPIGTGGIGIVRVSGQDALKIADAIFVFKSESSELEYNVNIFSIICSFIWHFQKLSVLLLPRT